MNISKMFLESIIILAFSNINDSSPPVFQLRKNIIQNSCNFEIIRFNKNDITCFDYGLDVKYCDHDIIPNEFIIYNEVGLNNKKNLIIKPYAIWSEYDSYQKVLDFHYVFECDGKYNNANLIVNVVPNNDYQKNMKTQIIKVLYIVMALAVNICLINICFNNIIENNRVYGLNALNRLNRLNSDNHRRYSQ